jgi:hypothetical protein
MFPQNTWEISKLVFLLLPKIPKLHKKSWWYTDKIFSVDWNEGLALQKKDWWSTQIEDQWWGSS